MVMTVRHYLCTAGVAALILGMQLANAAASPFDPPMRSVQVGDVRREYYLHKAVGKKPRPLLIVIGGDQLPVYVMRKLEFELLADTENFSVVYPRAFKGKWVDGRDTDFAINHKNINDIDFIEELIDVLEATGVADPAKVYLVGFSDGGILAYSAACALSDKVKAVATVAASMPAGFSEQCRPSGTLDVLAINATLDSVVPWKGGQFRVPGNDANHGSVMPVNDTVAFWRTHNQCGQALEDKDYDPKNPATRSIRHYRWKGCNVQQTTLLGAGHGWPGSGYPQLFSGTIGAVHPVKFDATKAIWGFITGKDTRGNTAE